MSLQLPAELAWVAGLINEPFPAGDEDHCREQAARWRRLADQLATYETDIGAAVRTTLEGFASGFFSDALTSQFQTLTSGRIDDLVAQLRHLGDAMQNVGDEIERAKRAIIVKLAQATIAIKAILASASDQWAAAYDVAAVVIATRAAVSTIIDNAVAAVARDAAGRSISPIAFGPAPAPVSTNGEPPAPTAPAPQPAPTVPNGQLPAPNGPVPARPPAQPPARPPATETDDAAPAPIASATADDPPATTAADPPDNPTVVAPTTTTTSDPAPADTTTAPAVSTKPPTISTAAASDTGAATTPAPTATSDSTATATTKPADATPATTGSTPAPTNATHDSSSPAPTTTSTHDTGATTGKVGTTGSDSPAGSSDGHAPTVHAGDTPTGTPQPTTAAPQPAAAAPQPAAAANSASGSAPATTSSPAGTTGSSAATGSPSQAASSPTSGSSAGPSTTSTSSTSGTSTASSSGTSTTGSSSPSTAGTSGSDSSANPAARPASHAAAQQPATGDGTRAAAQSGESQTSKPEPAGHRTAAEQRSDAPAGRTAPEGKGTETPVQKASARPATDIGKALAGQQDRRDSDGTPSPPDSASAAPFVPMMPPMMPGMFGAGASGTLDTAGPGRQRRILKLDGAEAPEPADGPGDKPGGKAGGKAGGDDTAAGESHSSLHTDQPEETEPDSVSPVSPADRFSDLSALDYEQSRQLADDVLARADMTCEKLRHRLGDVDLCAHRAKANAEFWAQLSDAEHRALVRGYPVEIADSVGSPLEARVAAAELLLAGEHLAHVRAGAPLDGGERQLLHRLGEIRALLEATRVELELHNPSWGVYPWAFDPGSGRIVVMVGADPRLTGAHHLHVPGPTADLDATLAHAVDDLARHQAEHLDGAVTATAWIGWPAADAGRAGPILRSDVAVFSVEHDSEGFAEHHVFAHPDRVSSSGALADATHTISLAGPPGPAPTSEPETSFDRRTEPLRAHLFGGRYLGCGLGVDPALHLLQRRPRVVPNFGGQPVSRRLHAANPCVRRVGQLR